MKASLPPKEFGETDKPIKILLVEDNPGDARLVREMLAEVPSAQFELTHVERLSEALKCISEERFDVVLLDLLLPDSQGLETFVKMHEKALEVPIVVLTVLGIEDLAVEAVRKGAQDYLVKGGVDSNLLVRSMRCAIERKRAEEEALRQQFMRISLLNQIARAILERQDLQSIFRVVLQHLEDHLPIDFGCVCLYDAVMTTLTTIAHGRKSQSLAVELGVAQGMTVPVEQTAFEACGLGEMVYMPDTSQVDAPFPQKLAQAGVRSLVAAPLAVENKVLGVLVVARREVNAFSSAEADFLQQLSEHVALAAQQARLHRDLQQAYDELLQTRRAVMQQERLKALGQMASGIAHDINNALSPIIGYTDLLLQTEPDLSERARRFLETMKTAAEDITHTVARMREFYRQREQQEALFPVNLNQLVHQVIDLTRPRWSDMPQERGIVIEIKTDLQDDLPLVIGVESEIREAITNLIFNAVDAMPEGGVITMRSRVYDAKVFLEVTDTGVGMDEETKQRCLEPFYTTKGERGTGLGLAMVYGIMQRHEGEIEIESEFGKGTTVRLIFPVSSPVGAGVSAAPTGTAETPFPTLHILCIDDDPLLRGLLKEMLESDGHRVEVADGGQEGLDAFRAAKERGERFDVVITDLGMPYLDGREVAKTVKSESPTTPVIMLTGWRKQTRTEGSSPAHVDYLLGKPPKMTELREALWQVTRTPHQGLIQASIQHPAS